MQGSRVMNKKTGKFIILLSAIISSNALAVNGDEPDYSKEARFHQIYKTYNENPTESENWSKAIESHSAEVYEIQKGDTLSGVSTTLFGDQFFWPKLWSLNQKDILNPHEINPGLKLQFIAGNLSEAPQLEIGSTDEKEAKDSVQSEEPSEKNESEESDRLVSEKKKKKVPVLRQLPLSLPAAHYTYLNSNNKLNFDSYAAQKKKTNNLEYLNYYAVDNPIAGVGQIVGTELSSKVANEFQYIFVKLEGNSGKDFVVQKNYAEIKDSSADDAKMVQVQGEIEVIEPVNPEEKIYRAIVKKCIDPVEVGALLTPGKLSLVNIDGGAPEVGPAARIIGGAYDNKRKIIGPRSVVFLSVGTDHAVKVGQIFNIFADESKRNLPVEVNMNERIVGVLKIVHVGAILSTGYIVKSNQDILVGDFVGQSGGRGKQVSSSEQEVPVEDKTTDSKSDNKDDFSNEPSVDSNPPDSGTDEGELSL
jgi:hypothetical protein